MLFTPEGQCYIVADFSLEQTKFANKVRSFGGQKYKATLTWESREITHGKLDPVAQRNGMVIGCYVQYGEN